MRRLLFFILLVSVMLSLPAAAKRFTQGFRLAKMRLDFPHQAEWEIETDSSIYPILNQRFSFLGKGAQCYAFESEDGNYVVKLFRYDRLISSDKIVHLFNACKIAYDHLQEETGLIYIHLNPTVQNLPTILCKDPIGRTYKIPLDQARFAVQRKGVALWEGFEKAFKDPQEMEEKIDQFLALLQSRTAKRIINTDSNLSRNFGFIEGRALEFDFGNYRYCPELNREAEMKKYISKLRLWLSLKAPEWVSYLDKKVEALN